MTSKKTWFGTRGFETWVPTPSINPDYGRVGWSSGEQQYLTGEVGIRESKNAHNVYVLSWGTTNTRDAIRTITDFADGVFDAQDGKNLVYWIDPMARDKNVLSQSWATPALGTEDAPALITSVRGTGRPVAVPTPANDFRYPARGARYAQDRDSLTREQYIPIPPGYTAWVGIHGDTDRVMQVQRVRGYEAVGSPVPMRNLALTSRLVDAPFTSQECSGIVLSFTSTFDRRVFTLYALVVQILPNGQEPTGAFFISGQGHSGCEFVGKPSKTPYSAHMDRVALTARLVETGMAQ